MKNIVQKFFDFFQTLVIALIEVYQKTLSPDHGWIRGRYPYGYCRYYPSCSEYSKQAVSRFGVAKGGWLSVKRLGKCHPFAEPKIDPVPEN